jgi:anthraniloyl-CoA monooxygenase
MGDAAHAAHFTLASGTRQALKDAVCLAGSLRARPDLSEALRHYDERRRASANRVVASGRRRSEKWEHLDGLLEHDALDFIHAKSGVPDAQLRRRRPLYRAEQLGAVRAARRQVQGARRWYRTRQRWSSGDGLAAVPAPGPARSPSSSA